MVTALNEKSVYISLIFSQDPLGLCVCLKEKSASASWTLPPTWVPGVLEADCLMCTEARRSELKRDRTSAQFNPDWRSGSQMRSSDWRMSCCCYLERKKPNQMPAGSDACGRSEDEKRKRRRVVVCADLLTSCLCMRPGHSRSDAFLQHDAVKNIHLNVSVRTL